MNRGKTERLLNLVFALMATARPVSREEIRRTVSGYDSEAADETFERMFERDKDELRSMGIPVHTVTNAFDEVLGYLITRENYQLIDLSVTAREIQILSVSQNVWDQAVLAPAARSAVWKMEASPHADPRATPSLTSSVSDLQVGFARVRAKEAAILPLLKAAREHKVVQFVYKPLNRDPEMRLFEPWAVMCRSGRWYSVGFDLMRDEQRTFKLARIQGAVNVTARDSSHSSQWKGLDGFTFTDSDVKIDAAIGVSQTHGAALRRAAKSIQVKTNHDLIHVNATEQELVEWILTSLPEIHSIEPPSLHENVVTVLEKMAVNYRG